MPSKTAYPTEVATPQTPPNNLLSARLDGSLLRSLTSAKAEVLWIVLLFFLYGGTAAPNVNEAHYLGKAKHYWDSSFCSPDFFYNSRDAHTAFFFTIGGLTRWLSLTATAWTGRLIGWFFLAWSWQSLCREVIPRRGAALFSAAVWLALIEAFQMSGEWIIGGIEAKVLAYAFVFFGLREMLRKRYAWAWSFFGMGAAFHVLVGGWAVITGAFAWLVTRRRGEQIQWSGHVAGLLTGGLISLAGLLPALALNANESPETVRLAEHIYVYNRLSHHLLISAFSSLFVLRHCVLVGVFLSLWYTFKNRRPFALVAAFAGGAVVLLCVGALLDVTLGRSALGASVMRYYWFRQSDIFVPMSVAFGLTLWLADRFVTNPRLAIRVATACVAALAIHAAVNVTYAQRSWIPPADRQGGIRYLVYLREWKDACSWIDRHTDAEAVFLTPPEHQTFKWYAHRAEIVSWKDVPQDAKNLVEWSARLTAVKEWQDSPNPKVGATRLEKLRADYPFDYLVTRWPTASPLPTSAQPIFRNRRYAIFRLDSTTERLPTIKPAP